MINVVNDKRCICYNLAHDLTLRSLRAVPHIYWKWRLMYRNVPDVWQCMYLMYRNAYWKWCSRRFLMYDVAYWKWCFAMYDKTFSHIENDVSQCMMFRKVWRFAKYWKWCFRTLKMMFRNDAIGGPARPNRSLLRLEIADLGAFFWSILGSSAIALWKLFRGWPSGLLA